MALNREKIENVKQKAYLKAGFETGTKAEAEAKQAAIQKAVFIVVSNK